MNIVYQTPILKYITSEPELNRPWQCSICKDRFQGYTAAFYHVNSHSDTLKAAPPSDHPPEGYVDWASIYAKMDRKGGGAK